MSKAVIHLHICRRTFSRHSQSKSYASNSAAWCRSVQAPPEVSTSASRRNSPGEVAQHIMICSLENSSAWADGAMPRYGTHGAGGPDGSLAEYHPYTSLSSGTPLCGAGRAPPWHRIIVAGSVHRPRGPPTHIRHLWLPITPPDSSPRCCRTHQLCRAESLSETPTDGYVGGATLSTGQVLTTLHRRARRGSFTQRPTACNPLYNPPLLLCCTTLHCAALHCTVETKAAREKTSPISRYMPK